MCQLVRQQKEKNTYTIVYRTSGPYYQGKIFGQIIASYDYSGRYMSPRLIEKN